jgi:TonB family protein
VLDFVGLIGRRSVFHTIRSSAMRSFRFSLRCAFCLAIFAIAGCGRKPSSQLVGESPAPQSPSPPIVSNSPQAPALSPSPIQAAQIQAGQRPALDLSRLENAVQPAVFWITVFDSSGKLLRTETAFFISGDGRFLTTAHAIEGGVNAVAKIGDGRIYNVSGVLAASTTLDVALLQADVKYVPFLTLNKNANLEVDRRLGVVGSGLAGTDGAPRDVTISSQQPDRLEIAGPISSSSIGSPIVGENGEVVGVVISAGEKATVRPSNAVDSLLGRIGSDATPRWPEVAQAGATSTPSPRPTPKPRLVYAPAPAFPPSMSRPGISGTGRFRLTFDARGNVTNVQVVQSTGNPYFDSSAIQTLRQWKSSPSQGWAVTVPVTFQRR